MKSMSLFKLCERAGEATLIVFAINAIILLTVLIILWEMPDINMDNRNCEYMCMQFASMRCDCRDEIFLQYNEMKFNQAYSRFSKMYTEMFKSDIPGNGKLYIGPSSDVKPVAHLVGERRENFDKDDTNKTMVTMKKWHRSNDCLLLNGMRLNHGRVRVPVKGWYHVYSVIDFSYQYQYDEKIKSLFLKGRSGAKFLKHSIFKSKQMKGVQEDEVCSTHHPFELSQNMIYSHYSSFLSRDVYLNAGDELYIKVEDVSLTVNPPRNIFGVYMI